MRGRWIAGVVAVVAVAALGMVLVVDEPAEGVVLQGAFTDDDGSVFETDIDAIAAAGITKGCNPPANTRFCPDGVVTRGQMAAFLARALGLPGGPDAFDDDDLSIFEADIDAIAAAGITKGCNPPANTWFCPDDDVTRGQMAAFLRRALGLPAVLQAIPVGEHPEMRCSKDGSSCSLVVDLSAGRSYRVEEGWYVVLPASDQELAGLGAANTSFGLTDDGSSVALTQWPTFDEGGLRYRVWRGTVTFPAGTHSLVGRWRWRGDVELTTIVTVRAGG